jgi:STE24 endopeptidase
LDTFFTAAELAQARAFNAPVYAWVAVRDFVQLGLFALVLRWGIRLNYRASGAISGWLSERLGFCRRVPVLRAFPAALDKLWGEPGWGLAVVFCLLYLLFFKLVFLPVDIYFDYVHPHRFELSNLTPGRYVLDRFKGVAAGSLAVTLLTFGLYGLCRRLRLWWLVLGAVAGAGLLVSATLDPWRATYYFDQRPLEAGPLRTELTEVLDRAQVQFRDVLIQDVSSRTRMVGAYFAGQGPTRTIVLSDTLVDMLGTAEVVAAVAHEAAHVREPTWPRRIFSSLGLVAFLFLVDRLLRLAARRRWFGATRFGDVRTLPLLGIALWALTLVFQPVSAAHSRARELAADAYALELTDDPQAFRRLLVEVTRLNKMDPDPPAWLVWRQFSHPPVRERLAQVAAFEETKKTSGR